MVSLDATVVGISAQDLDSHEQFVAATQHPGTAAGRS